MIEGCGKFRGYSENLRIYCNKYHLCERCKKEKQMYSLIKGQETKGKKRASFYVSFELAPYILGFGSDIKLSGVDVDHGREMITFYLVGDGLPDDYETPEGAEPKSIIPAQEFS